MAANLLYSIQSGFYMWYTFANTLRFGGSMASRLESPIIIVGPTGIGKSSLVRAVVARVPETESVVADDYYLYAGEHFYYGLGLTNEDARGPASYLRGSFLPHEPCPTPPQYVQLASKAVEQIHRRGKFAIIEGCHFGYSKALLDYYGSANVLRVTFADDDGPALECLVRNKFLRLVQQGLYSETRAALAKGYRDTFPMTSLIYSPVIRAIDGESTPEEAQRAVVRKWVGEIYRTDAKLGALSAGSCISLRIGAEDKPTEQTTTSFMDKVIEIATSDVFER